MTMSILGLALLGVVQEQPKLDLNVKGETLATIANQIGEQMGWEIQLDPTVRSEVLVIRTDGMDSQKTIAKIGELTGTRWTLNGQQMIIQPDVNVRNAELAKQRTLNYQSMLKRKSELLVRLSKSTVEGPDGLEFPVDRGAGTQLLAQLVGGLGDQFWSRIGPGQRIVFSTNPTRMQQALGRVNVQLVNQWVADVNESRKVDPADMANAANDPDSQTMMEMFGIALADMIPKPITETPEKVLLVVSRSGDSEFDQVGVTVTVKVTATGGKTILSEEESFGASGNFGAMAFIVEELMESEGEVTPRKAMPDDDLKLMLSEEYVEMRKAGRFNMGGSMPTSMDPKVRAKFVDVLNNEPLRYELGELLYIAAEMRDQPLVALLPDDLNRFDDSVPETLGNVRDQFSRYDMEEKSDQGWWQIAPTNFARAWDGRVDRVTLAAVLSAADGKTFIPLDPLANFVYQNPTAFSNDVATSRLEPIAPGLTGGVFGGGESSIELYRIFGSLSAGERQAVRRGVQLPIAQLSAATRGVLSEMFFGSDGGITPVDLEKSLAQVKPLDAMGGMMGMGMMLGGGMFGGTVSDEPTEIMPGGLPSNGFLATRGYNEQYVVAVDKDGRLVSNMPPFGRTEVAFVSLLLRNPAFLSEAPEAQEFLARLVAGERRQIHMAVMVAPGLGAKGVLSDTKDPDMKKVYSLSNLPGELGANAKQDADEIAASPMGKFFQMMGGGMGGFGGGGGTIKP